MILILENPIKIIKVWLLGGLTGFTTAGLFLLSMLIFGMDNHIRIHELGIAMGITPILTATVVSKLAKLKLIIPLFTAYATLIVPVFGITFGAPNMGMSTVISIVVLGFVGGLFWSIPFALWTLKTSPLDS